MQVRLIFLAGVLTFANYSFAAITSKAEIIVDRNGTNPGNQIAGQSDIENSTSAQATASGTGADGSGQGFASVNGFILKASASAQTSGSQYVASSTAEFSEIIHASASPAVQAQIMSDGLIEINAVIDGTVENQFAGAFYGLSAFDSNTVLTKNDIEVNTSGQNTLVLHLRPQDIADLFGDGVTLLSTLIAGVNVGENGGTVAQQSTADFSETAQITNIVVWDSFNHPASGVTITGESGLIYPVNGVPEPVLLPILAGIMLIRNRRSLQ
jgi:hypothetical protein